MIKQGVTLKHFVTVEELTNDTVLQLIERAIAFKNGETFCFLEEKFVSNLFFESSTRTHRSFEMAEKRLGLKVIDFDPSTSSLNKGETLYDTVLTLSALGVDAVVIRSSQEAYYRELIDAPNVHCAILNGGDGAGQHPSQCMLDVMTIYEQFGRFDGLKVGIVGDLAHSRVANSNMQLLQRLGAQVFFSGPEHFYRNSYDQYGQFVPLDELVDVVDVLMLLRVQTERLSEEERLYDHSQSYLEQYGLTKEREQRMKESAIIMHPAPVNRGVEIDTELVECPRSKIVEQMTNGVYMRMAILEAVLRGNER